MQLRTVFPLLGPSVRNRPGSEPERMRPRGGFALLALPLAAFLTGGAAPQADRHSGTTVTVAVSDLRNAKGVVRACMTRNAEIFPRCRDQDSAYRHFTGLRAYFCKVERASQMDEVYVSNHGAS